MYSLRSALPPLSRINPEACCSLIMLGQTFMLREALRSSTKVTKGLSLNDSWSVHTLR